MQAAMRRYAEEVRRTRLLAVQITTPGSILLTATALRLVEGLAQVSGARGAGPV
jgi:hypothetical protein